MTTGGSRASPWRVVPAPCRSRSLRSGASLLSLLLAVGLAAGCGYRKLEARIEVLELQLAQQQRSAPNLNAEARRAVEGVRDHVRALDFQAAVEACDEAEPRYARTRLWEHQGQICRDVRVVGRDAAPLPTQGWYQGGASLDAPLTLLAFFETWCVHCRREIPKLQAVSERLEGQVDVVALTQVRRSATDETVRDFIEDYGLTFPVARDEDGRLSQHYDVRPVPATVLLHRAKVVWRGHPSLLDDATFEALLRQLEDG